MLRSVSSSLAPSPLLGRTVPSAGFPPNSPRICIPSRCPGACPSPGRGEPLCAPAASGLGLGLGHGGGWCSHRPHLPPGPRRAARWACARARAGLVGESPSVEAAECRWRRVFWSPAKASKALELPERKPE